MGALPLPCLLSLGKTNTLKPKGLQVTQLVTWEKKWNQEWEEEQREGMFSAGRVDKDDAEYQS